MTKVLIIEDDESFQQILELKLGTFMKDLEITSFSSISAARTWLSKQEVIDLDLVILDQHLPDGRGVDLLFEEWFQDLAVLAVSSDDSPEMPGETMKAGAAYFLNKTSVTQGLFKPLVEGIIERNALRKELNKLQLNNAIIDTVKTLVSTLRHEINNPLGAVLGATYLIRNNQSATKEQIEAAELAEESGKRIKHVLDKLTDAMQLEPVTKADQKVFHIPGDEPWEK
ncbi:MAG: response regulator [Bdellovibrionales bacterium]|nr:response regulator [Bdellovibrionales bacterium]